MYDLSRGNRVKIYKSYYNYCYYEYTKNSRPKFFVKKLASPEAKGVLPEVVGYLPYRLSRLPI